MRGFIRLDKKKSNKPVYRGNSIMVRPGGPLICKGDAEITLQNEDEALILKDKEFALCRCGFSNNKPFCDGAHKTKNTPASQIFNDNRKEDIINIEESLVITVKQNAMYSVKGAFTLFSRDGASKTTRTKAGLCRCGQSENKPFCDMSHKKCGFIAK